MSDRNAVRAIILNDDKVLAIHRHKFGSEYYTLIGGGVELGEDMETALRREIREEAQMEVGTVQLVFVENAPDPFGPQYIFLCEYVGGDPVLSETSDEAHISALGQNMYEPVWLPLSQVPVVPFRSTSAAEALLGGVRNGFPEKPIELAWKPGSMQK